MRALPLIGLGIASLVTAQSVTAQTPRFPSLQAELGLAFRDVPVQSHAAGEGAQGLGRVLIPLQSQLRAFGEVSITRFPTRTAAVPATGPCPIGTLCTRQLSVATGPRILSLSMGLQRRLNTDPVIIQLSGFAGRSWLSRRAAGSAGAAFSLGGAASLLFPGSRHVRPVIEARAVRLLASDSNPRWLGGLAVGAAID